VSKTRPANTTHLTALAEMEALHRAHGSGLKTDAARIVNLKVANIKTCETAFQPRSQQESARAIAENIDALTDLLKADTDRAGFDPLLVFPIAGAFFVLDGHCRLEAYKKAGWTACRVRVFTGSFSDALDETTRLNAEVRLTLTNRERGEVAWRRVVHHTQNGSALSIRELAHICCVPKTRVGAMVKLLKEGIPGHALITREEIASWSWVYVAWVLRNGVEKRGEFDREEQVARIGRSLRTHMRRTVEHTPALFWAGLVEGFGEAQAEEIHRSFCNHRGEVEDDAAADF
jgi:hypothetical protein